MIAMSHRKLQGVFILNPDAFEAVYGEADLAKIERHVCVSHPVFGGSDVDAHLESLHDVEVIFSGWGGPLLDEALLDHMPRLKAFFYAAGALNSVVTPAVWDRDIVVTSAAAANAIPVVEYTLATALFSLRHGWQQMRATRAQQAFPGRDHAPGGYRSTIGLISLGIIARALLARLRPFDLEVIAYDPYVSDAEAARLNIRKVSLDEVFEQADVVSLHSPLLPETRGLVGREHFRRMKHGACFINTARGEIVREPEMIAVAKERGDLQFVLDVTHPEPPVKGSPLYTLPNVVLTPHIAGSLGGERRRLGHYMVEELERFVSGCPLQWAVEPEHLLDSSHRPRAMTREMLHETLAGRRRSASSPSGSLSPSGRVAAGAASAHL